MKAKRTFSRHGRLFREGEKIPQGTFPEHVVPLLISEGWIEDEAATEVRVNQIVAKPARKKSKK